MSLIKPPLNSPKKNSSSSSHKPLNQFPGPPIFFLYPPFITRSSNSPNQLTNSSNHGPRHVVHGGYTRIISTSPQIPPLLRWHDTHQSDMACGPHNASETRLLCLHWCSSLLPFFWGFFESPFSCFYVDWVSFYDCLSP